MNWIHGSLKQKGLNSFLYMHHTPMLKCKLHSKDYELHSGRPVCKTTHLYQLNTSSLEIINAQVEPIPPRM